MECLDRYLVAKTFLRTLRNWTPLWRVKAGAAFSTNANRVREIGIIFLEIETRVSRMTFSQL